MPNIDLHLMLSSERNQSGVLVVRERESRRVLAQFEALGRGSKGPGDTQMRVNGNTPTGQYRVSQLQDTSGWDQHSYGPHGALRLEPVSGNAAAAEAMAGRKGLLIHGGAPGGEKAWRGAGELRATHGCVRLSNLDMKKLGDVLFNATMDLSRRQSTSIEVSLTVADYQMSFMRP